MADHYDRERPCGLCAEPVETRTPPWVPVYCNVGCQLLSKTRFVGGCWVWTGTIAPEFTQQPRMASDALGYSPGGFPNPTPVQKVTFALRWLRWPKHVTATCARRYCLNPEHLKESTYLEMRRALSEAGPLDPDVVMRIREMYAEGGHSIRGLAEQFRIGRWAVEGIVTGATYRWVGGPIHEPNPNPATNREPRETRVL